jgi:radical SAM superfamily enzyme YgiQ (UPF0313 family)
VRGNEPIAPGYLKAAVETWAAERGLAGRVEVEVLPRELVDRLGDRALARAIAAREPHVLGLSLFLWNSARSTALARAVKVLRPELAVVVGGPEVTRDNPWCVAEPGVDLGVVGEGEGTLVELVAWLQGSGPAELERIAGLAIPERSRGTLPLAGQVGESPVQLREAKPGEPQASRGVNFSAARPALDLSRVASPYLSGAIPPGWDGLISVETLRGCPFKCSFCYYYKQFAKTQPFPRGWLQDHFRFARDRGMRELFFLDPTLNARPHFSEFLDEVIAANEGGALELHAELVADMVDDRIADKLERANVRGVEVGLQSANMDALKAVNRMCDLERFAAGVTRMDRRGITVKTDLIVGLPEDDERSVSRSMDWVKTRELDADVQVFHLMVLPGTELREKADAFGIERLARPPYYATRTRWIDEAAMRRSIERAGRVFALEFDPHARPLVGAPLVSGGAASSCWSRATVELAPFESVEDARAAGEAAGESAANALTVTVHARDLSRELPRAAAYLEALVEKNPHATLDVLVDARAPVSIDDLARLKSAAATPEAYLNGYDRFQVEPGTLVSTRVSVVLDRSERPCVELEAVVPVIYRARGRSLEELERFLDAHPGREVLVHREGALALVPRERVIERLAARVGDDADALSFALTDDARAWESVRGRSLEDAPPEVELAPSFELAPGA